MRLLLLLCSCGLAIVLAGCDSMPSRVRERFANVPPKTRTVDADKRTAYYAAQMALRKIGCTLSRADISDGFVEGLRPVQTSPSSRTSRDALQVTLVIRLNTIDSGHTEVAVLVHELQTGDFPGGAMDRPLREHSLYGSYFAALEEVLRNKDAVKLPPKS